MKRWVYAGRVKTLHPTVHGGILAKRADSNHQDALAAHNIGFIDVVIVNLYPFRQTVTASQQPTFDNAVEQIDIGETLPLSNWQTAQGLPCCYLQVVTESWKAAIPCHQQERVQPTHHLLM